MITAGGSEVKVDKEKGYVTSHIILNRKDMLADTDSNYVPDIGRFDGTLRPEKGTIIRMRMFDHRIVPELDDFERQLSQRFGVQSPNWKLVLRDNQKTAADPDATRTVGELNIELRLGTRIEFREELTPKNKSYSPPKYLAFDEGGKAMKDLKGSFEFEGKEYPVTGWVGYSKVPYRDQQMAGVRIYCRGKLTAQTLIFGRKAGFTGEYDIRSYFVGMLNADWLDDEEDLILTSRQDILWSEPLARAFEEWGQGVVKKVGTITREPVRQAAWDLFVEETNVEEEVEETYPADEQRDIREKTIEIAKMMVKAARPDELQDEARRRSMVDLALLVGPHITLEEKLIEAAENDDNTLEVVADILRTARVAELTSFGRIADDRVKVIKKVEKMKDDEDTLDDAFQALIEESPWLINPEWSPITTNTGLEKLKGEFVKFYRSETGERISLYKMDGSDKEKRAELVITNQDRVIEVILIKRPGDPLKNAEMDRLVTYHDSMDAFLHKKGEEDYLKGFEKFHITLVCDSLALKGAQKVAFDGLQASGADAGGVGQIPPADAEDARSLSSRSREAKKQCREAIARSD